MPDEYDGYAAGQVLYGDVTPTGKLTSTWYADMSAFPLLDDSAFQTEPTTLLI